MPGKKLPPKKTIISCSRRTDVPAFHYRWLQRVLADGFVVQLNPYNNKDYTINLCPEEIHSIVLWSKNFQQVLDNPGLLSEYNLYFQFTMNGYGAPLELRSITEDQALAQLVALTRRYAPEQVNWRFDPLLFVKGGDPVQERLDKFDYFAQRVASLGITRCTISYVTFYPDVVRRLAQRNIEYFDFDDDFKVLFSKNLSDLAAKHKIQLCSCSTPVLEKNPAILRSHCVDGLLLEKLFSGSVSHAKDSGQRAGCGCTASRDIGAYSMRCPNGCLYCYGNPFHV